MREQHSRTQYGPAQKLGAEVYQHAALAAPLTFCRSLLGFFPDARQAEVLSSQPRRLLLCCSRQWGKSTTAAAMIVAQAVAEPGCLILCAAPTLRQSGLLVSKVAEMLERAGIAATGGKLRLTLENKSRIIGLPGNEANIRGFSAPALIVVDEAARVSDAVYAALRPMLITGNGKLALLSTPFGQRGFFWKEWAGGAPHWHRVEVKATDCPRITAEVLEEERLSQSEEWFAQEYLCSFIGMENQAFRAEWLAAAAQGGIGVKALDFPLRGGTLQKGVGR